MIVLWAPYRILSAINTPVLRVGRWLAGAALAIMVVVILAQVVFRYVVGSALAWPDEAARFFMLWMTGLIAPSAYRWGGFVAIDMVPMALPRLVGQIVTLVLLALALLVLVTAVPYGLRHVTSGCLFTSSSLWLPFSFHFSLPIPLTEKALTLCTKEPLTIGITMGWAKVPLAAMYASLLWGIYVMISVNIELILRNLIMLFDREADLQTDPEMIAAGAD
ncbi:MAG TPA: TRAP transporter small permease subunit [Paracoccaceae bacterium]|nr:TRAP transporter small permease subunit [Paracoccaceae bacterium]